jgi:hypothetical protein
MSDDAFWRRERRIRRDYPRQRASDRLPRRLIALAAALATGAAILGLALSSVVPHKTAGTLVADIAAYFAAGFGATLVYTVIADGPRAFSRLVRPKRR